MSNQKFLVSLHQYEGFDGGYSAQHLGVYDSKEIAEGIAKGYRDALIHSREGINLPRYSNVEDVEIEVTPVEENAPPAPPVPIFLGFVESTPPVRLMLTNRGERFLAFYVDPNTGHDIFGSLDASQSPSTEQVLEALNSPDKTLSYEFPYSTIVKGRIQYKTAQLAFSSSRETLERYIKGIAK